MHEPTGEPVFVFDSEGDFRLAGAPAAGVVMRVAGTVAVRALVDKVLPPWVKGAIGEELPDVATLTIGYEIHVAGCEFFANAMMDNVIGPETGGKLGNVDFGRISVLSLSEVTTTKNELYVEDRAEKIATLAAALRGTANGQVRTIAVLAIDRDLFEKGLTENERATLVDLVVHHGGYITLWPGLCNQVAKKAKEIFLQLK